MYIDRYIGLHNDLVRFSGKAGFGVAGIERKADRGTPPNLGSYNSSARPGLFGMEIG